MQEKKETRNRRPRNSKGRGRSRNGRSRNEDERRNGNVGGSNEPRPPRELKGDPQVLKLFDLQVMDVPDLAKIADGFGLEDLGALRKHELIFEILSANAELKGTMFSRGVLEVLPDGFGFLRSPYYNYLPCPEDP